MHDENTVLQLKISLVSTEPPIWRRFLVRSDINLCQMHAILQFVMGWTNSHLHRFFHGRKRFVDFAAEEERSENTFDERKQLLSKLLKRVGDSIVYEYDFGDSWRHDIVLESLLTEYTPFKGPAVCVDGARACPPDDCGGVSGFYDFLEAIGDPNHEEHKSMTEWIGRPYDAEKFDMTVINKYLGKLIWKYPDWEEIYPFLTERDGGFNELEFEEKLRKTWRPNTLPLMIEAKPLSREAIALTNMLNWVKEVMDRNRVEKEVLTAVFCIEKIKRKKCNGMLSAIKHKNGSIDWRCRACGKSGTLMSGKKQRPYFGYIP